VNLRQPPGIATLRAAWWARTALLAARRALAAGEVSKIELPPPPPLPTSASRGIEAVLRRCHHTCLEGALVRQRWLAGQGLRREIAIGVTSPSEGFSAHAWLVGEEDPTAQGFRELTRLQP
jgi:Transglutaminase-like superfamily